MGIPAVKNEELTKKTRLLSKLLRLMTIKDKNQEALVEEKDEKQRLVEGLEHAKKEWDNAVRDFEYVEDDEIIDYYTYKITACQIRYGYFLKEAKKKGIKINKKMHFM